MYDLALIAGVPLWAGLLWWYLRQPAASAFHPASFYFLFHGVLFMLRPILARVQHFEALYRIYDFTPTPADKLTVLLGADLALVTFVLVCVRVGRQPLVRAAGTTRRAALPRLTLSLWLMAAACLPLAIASLAAGWQTRVTGSSMVLQAGTGLAINTTGNGYFSDAVLMIGPITVLLAWAMRFRALAFVPLAMFVLVKAGTGGRWPFIMALLSAGLWWMFEHRHRWPPARVVLLAVPLVALFTIVGQDRGASVRALFAGEALVAAPDLFRERPLESMDFANMEFFEYLAHVVPAKTGTYGWFLDNLQVVTEPVPRVLWPGKPVGAPVQLFALWDYGTPIGMTYSLPGNGWMQAGWLGIVLWTALFAWAYGHGYALFVRSDQSRFKVAIYMILLPVSLQVFRDGVLLSALRTSFFPLVPVLAWRLFARFDGTLTGRAAAAPA